MDQPNSQQIPGEIRQFLVDILEEANIQSLDDTMKEGMIQELFYQLDNYLASVITDNLQPADLDTFVKMNEEKKSQEEIETFVKEKIPNAQDLFTNAFAGFRNIYLENITKVREQQPQE